MLDVIEKLVSRMVELEGHRSGRRGRFFDNCVKPAYEAFEAVHHSYVRSFQRLRSMLNDPSQSLGQVERALRDEIIEGATGREKLRQHSLRLLGQSESYSSWQVHREWFRPRRRDPLLLSFAQGIGLYFCTVHLVGGVGDENTSRRIDEQTILASYWETLSRLQGTEGIVIPSGPNFGTFDQVGAWVYAQDRGRKEAAIKAIDVVLKDLIGLYGFITSLFLKLQERYKA